MRILLSAVLLPMVVLTAAAGERDRGVKVSSFGYDPADSTEAIQKALDSGQSRLILDRQKGPWITRPLRMRSNCELVLEEGVELVAKRGEYKGKYESLLSCVSVTNVTIRGEGRGATFRMWKGDYQDAKAYVPAEWRHTLWLSGAVNVRIENLSFVRSGGDGICLGMTAGVSCGNVVIRKVVCDDNHRQGISVCSCDGLLIEDCVLSNTKGTMPQAGIDIEPNNPREPVCGILLRNVVSTNNAGSGVEVMLHQTDPSARPASVRFEDCRFEGCRNGVVIVGNHVREDRIGRGDVRLEGCRIADSRQRDIRIIGVPRGTVDIRFDGCTIESSGSTGFPDVSLASFGKRQGHPDHIEFNGLRIVKRNARPWIGRTGDSTGPLPSAIRGDVEIRNADGSVEHVTLDAEWVKALFPPSDGGTSNPGTSLEDGFREPPREAKPHTWYHMMNGNVTKAGITRDFEELAAAGIGGVQMFDAGCAIPAGPLAFNSPEWFDLLKHAASEAKRLGLEICLPNCSGWSSSGGPWNPASNAMKRVVFTETRVKGGGAFDGKLAQPRNPCGFYEDIAVLAVPVPPAKSLPYDGQRFTAEGDMIGVVSDREVEASGYSVKIEFQPVWRAYVHAEIEITRDGVNYEPYERRTFALSLSGRGSQDYRFFAFPAPMRLRGMRMRLRYENANSKTRPVVAKVADFRLERKLEITTLEYKTDEIRGDLGPQTFEGAADQVVAAKDVAVLTGAMAPDGSLRWTAPATAAEWAVLRIGHSTLPVYNHPASQFGRGFEVDKLSAAAMDFHFEQYVAKLCRLLGPLAGGETGLNNILVDSYEVGSQNWTQGLEGTFRARCGYDLVKYLPAFAGYIVGSVDETERFLWDFRRTVADLFAENYAGALARKCHEHGLRLSLEPYGSGPFDNLQYGRYADIPMGEFWSQSKHPGYCGSAGNSKYVSYVGHVWGRKFIGTESFTANPVDSGAWLTTPELIKPIGDAAYADGVNRIIYHRYVHQPWADDRYVPGLTMGQWGMHFDRHNTWWPYAKEFLRYQARCQFMLQRGTHVADVLFWCGEDAPNQGGNTDGGNVSPYGLPYGYDWDVCETEAFRLLRVEDGCVVAPGGTKYRLLVLPPNRTMTPESLAKIGELVRAGAKVAGPVRPSAAPGLRGYPSADARVSAEAGKVWAAGVMEMGAEAALKALGIAPDVACAGGATRPQWDHRRTDDADIYFLCRNNETNETVSCSFRVSGLRPEIWDAEKGTMSGPRSWREENGRTSVTLDFGTCGSAFVVFRPTPSRGLKPAVSSVTVSERTVGGPWDVSFAAKYDGAPTPRRFDRLMSWTESDDPDLRYLSGSATYGKTVEIAPPKPGERIVLDLGTVKNFAEVTVNGKTFPVLWKPPYRVDITEAILPSSPIPRPSSLSVKVTNLWPNRLIGDDALPADVEWKKPEGQYQPIREIPQWVKDGKRSPTGRHTFTTWRFWTADDPLLPSGLLGPVRLEVRSESAAEPLWKTPGLIPELKLDRECTASRWIWYKGMPKDGEVALFRLAFEADSPVSSGRLAFASDDIGHLYLNGTEVHPSRFAAAVKPGRNVMAVCVTNVYSMGGMIAFGDFTLKSGKTLGLRSNAAFRTLDAGKGIPSGWEKADFDDSTWMPAIELGDARMWPFSKYRDYTKDFATAAERAIAAAAEAAKSDWPLPAGLADEPEPSVRVVYEGNRPLVEVNGLRMEPDFSLSGGSNPFKLSSVAKMRELGIRFYRVDVSREEIEKEAGVWDFSKFDERAREILHFAPDGYLTLSVRLEMPKWLAGHPEAWIGYANGETAAGTGDERRARLRRPSAASPEYRAEAYRFLRAFGDYVRSRPWGRRVVAVRPCWGIYTEWHTYGFYEGPDVGPAMTAAFRRWKGGLYANENPPTMAERTHGATLLDPSADRKVIDYYDCMANEVSDFLIGCCRTVKEAFPGRLAGAYYGYLFAVHPPEGATAMLEKVLSAPEVDFLSDPAMYSSESRRAGGSYYHRTVTETFHRYGKLSIMEDDMRFHHIRGWTEKAITTETPRESRMTMRRNYLNKLFDGSGIQFCDPCAGREVRPFSHDDPDVLLGMSEAMDAVRKAGTQPKASGNDTVLVISALERFRRDGRPSGSKLIGRTYCALEWIYRSGIAFDIMTLDDFLREDRGYRHVVMLNAYGPSSAERAALKARLRRPGVTTLWLVAPGCVLPEGFSDAAMSDLTGLALRGAGRDPKVSCADGSAERIPQNGVRKTLSDGFVAAFLPEPPSDRWQWRSVLMALGAKPLADVGNYVRRHGDLILFHNAEPGEHVVVPPDDLAGRPCEDLFTGERHPAGPIRLRLDGVDTRLFRFVR